VLFAFGVSLLVGVVCGLWPLARLRTHDLAAVVREGDTRTASGAGRRFGNGLVVAEIALAFALLVGAGLLVKDLLRLGSRDAGFVVDRVVAFDVAPSGPAYESDERVLAFHRELYERLAALGTVERAGMTSHLPMYNFGWNGEMNVEGGNPWAAGDAPLVEYRWIHGAYLETLGVRLLRGRLLDARDGQGTRSVLINQAMADTFWPGHDPIGKRFGQGPDVSQWYEVVGVIANIRSYGLASQTPFEFFRTIEQSPFRAMTVVIRTRDGDPTTILPAARQIVASIDPQVPITTVQTMADVVSGSIGRPRLLSALGSLFGGLAGLLAMVGVYGVMSYNVRRQGREFGIRLALGADPRGVRRLVVGRGLWLAAIGVTLGGLFAFLVTRWLRTMLNDVEPSDPGVFAIVSACVLLVTLIASYAPARQASRTDPLVVLRES
jgi:predicted permease